jgi:hypothetical protein
MGGAPSVPIVPGTKLYDGAAPSVRELAGSRHCGAADWRDPAPPPPRGAALVRKASHRSKQKQRGGSGQMAYTWDARWGIDARAEDACRIEAGRWEQVVEDGSAPPGLLGRAKQRAGAAKAAAALLLEEKVAQVDRARRRPAPGKLHAAARRGDPEEVHYLLELMEETRSIAELLDARQPPSDVTPLLVACEHGHTSVVRQLLARRADVQAQCPGTKASPLLWACAGGHKDMVVELVSAGAPLWPPRGRVSSPASTNASDGQYTPYSILCENGRTGLLETLLNRSLLTKPPDPATSPWTRMGWSVAVGEGLVLGAARGEVGVVQLLLDREVQCDARDRKGWCAHGMHGHGGWRAVRGEGGRGQGEHCLAAPNESHLLHGPVTCRGDT